jgi:hypothetical protein
MSYQSIVTPIAERQLSKLAKNEPDVALAAMRLILGLRENPWLGEEMRERPRLPSLSDCRRIRFDREDYKGKPRYRLVYRNEPADGAPHVVAVLSVDVREQLRAYSVAAKSRAERLRELRGAIHERQRPPFDR